MLHLRRLVLAAAVAATPALATTPSSHAAAGPARAPIRTAPITAQWSTDVSLRMHHKGVPPC
jgi:hypothetical protein